MTHVIDKDSLEIKGWRMCSSKKSATFVILLEQRTVSAFRASADGIAGDFGQIHTSLRAANSRGHGSAE